MKNLKYLFYLIPIFTLYALASCQGRLEGLGGGEGVKLETPTPGPNPTPNPSPNPNPGPTPTPNPNPTPPSVTGVYDVGCYLNKRSTQEFGTNFYSISTFTFNANGTGSVTYEFSQNQDCALTSAPTTIPLTYTTEFKYGNVTMFHILQNESGTIYAYYLPASVVMAGIYFDVDFSDGTAAPYSAEPAQSAISQFISAPAVEGVLGTRR